MYQERSNYLITMAVFILCIENRPLIQIVLFINPVGIIYR